MKYFRLRAYTPYCGEELTAVAKGESEHEVIASGLPDDLMADCASEWFDPADYETFGYEDEEEYEEMYYQECGCEITEISEAEYLEELERLYGIKVLAVQADVNAGGDNEATVQNVIDQTIAAFGRIDVLINNAQASASGVPLATHTTEQFNLAMYSGLYAVYHYMQACYPYLKESKGSVINFASGAGLFGNYGQCSYAAAKEGIRGLSRVAATEWAPDGVRVNVICPLAMTEGLKKFKEEYPERYEQTIKGVPMGRFADPEKDVGGMCVFLCSDEASYVTGETITLQGGSGLRP